MNLSYEQLKTLAEIITEKSLIDYILPAGNLLISLALVILSCYIFIKTPKQTAKSKIHEKEVDLLYKAFESFCNFSDAVGLYISHKKIKYGRLSDPSSKPLEKNFYKTEAVSSEKAHQSFSEQKMASNILQSIGSNKANYLIDNYKNEFVKLRTLVINFEESTGPHQLHTYKNLLESIEKIDTEVDRLTNLILDEINTSKNTILVKI